VATLHDSNPTFRAPTARSIPRQTLGGLSLLLVVALTIGAARSGALMGEAARQSGIERAAAVLPRTVHHSERRAQRERPDARLASRPSRSRWIDEVRPVLVGDEDGAAVNPLRAELIDLPPPARA